MASITLKIKILGALAWTNRCKNWDTGKHGKHETKKQKIVVQQQGPTGAEIETL